MDISVYFECGTRSVEVNVIGSKLWETEDKSREYFDLACEDYVCSLYRVLKGGTRDLFVRLDGGELFGYKLNHRASDSKTKMNNAKEAIEFLSQKIISNGEIL